MFISLNIALNLFKGLYRIRVYGYSMVDVFLERGSPNFE